VKAIPGALENLAVGEPSYGPPRALKRSKHVIGAHGTHLRPKALKADGDPLRLYASKAR